MLFPGKMKSRWRGPFLINQDFENGVVELVHKDGSTFRVNGHRVKHYYAAEASEEFEDNFDWVKGAATGKEGELPLK